MRRARRSWRAKRVQREAENGGLRGINIEQIEMSKVFDELELWEAIIRSDPELRQFVQSLGNAGRDTQKVERKNPYRRPSRGPAP